jgi:CubicO group peptidase (beta-lactamase class C family)
MAGLNPTKIAAALSAECDRYAVPGAQLGLLHRGDRLVTCAGVKSVRSTDPVRPTTYFHAGSIAKSLVGLLLVDAARRGEVDLDRPCREQAPGTWPDTPRAIASQVTGRANLLPEPAEDIFDFVTRAAELPLVHPPGRFSYCNAGWPTLDLLLRHCSGDTFEGLATERILEGGGRFGTPNDGAVGHTVDPDGIGRPTYEEIPDAASAAGSRWWTTADELLSLAELHLAEGQGRFDPRDIRELRRAHAPIPGATVADSWGLGWGLWHRGEHSAFGWAGFTDGHRAYLRCFPAQQAAVVLLANSAGSLFGPPGGSALFDALLPSLLSILDVPPLPQPRYAKPTREAPELAGSYGPLTVYADGADAFDLEAAAFGLSGRLRHLRSGGDTFLAEGEPPGGTPIAFEAGMLYFGPFALARSTS